MTTDIRDKLKKLLDDRFIVLSHLCHDIGIHPQSMYDVFAHRRRLEASEFVRICQKVGLTLDDFQECCTPSEAQTL